MQHKLKHKITNPCHETWENMLPSPRGRYCFSCKKEVIDFTEMTEAEIALFLFQQQGKSFCSQMTQEQMQKEYLYIQPEFKISPVQKYVALFLAGLAVANSTGYAQSYSHFQPKTTQEEQLNKQNAQKSLSTPFTISGKLLREDTKMPLPNVELRLVVTGKVLQLIEQLKEKQSLLENMDKKDAHFSIYTEEVKRLLEQTSLWQKIYITTDENGDFSFTFPEDIAPFDLVITPIWSEPVRNSEGGESDNIYYGEYYYPSLTLAYEEVYTTHVFYVKKKKERRTTSFGF
ncbi:MAG: hypothetical protein ACKVTZ_21115 [Bacteroidia bacterium]